MPSDPALRAARESLHQVVLELSHALPAMRADLLDRYAYRMGELVGAGLLERPEVADLLYEACVANGLVKEIGADGVQEALAAGLTAGMQSGAHFGGSGHTGRTTEAEDQASASDRPAGRALISKRASEITPESVNWLWRGRIAVGKQTCVGGDPGTSKSTLAIAIAATVTTGGKWPCGEGKAPVGNVIILNAEDGAADTMLPRLLAAGADLERVDIVTAVSTEDGKGRRSFNLQADLDLLEAHIREIGNVVLIIIDPVSAYMGKGDSHKNTEVRQVLEPVGEMATRMRVAILTITHFSKSGNTSTTKALHRFIGSIAFIGAARAGFAVMEDPEDRGRLLFLHAKNNLAPPPQGLAYRLEERVAVTAKDGVEAIYASAIVWDDEPVGQTADEVLGTAGGGDGEPTAKDAVIEFLRQALREGPASVEAIERDARSAGLLRDGQRVNESKPFRSAKATLGIVSLKDGFQGGYKWALPTSAQP